MFGLSKVFLVLVILPFFMVFLIGAALGSCFGRR
jgi:hypothetical protein